MRWVAIACMLVGCGTTKILETGFNGSFPGPLQGTPTDDHLLVQSSTTPTQTGGNLEFNGTSYAFFYSRPVKSADNTKTISYKGRLNGAGAYMVHFQGGDSTPASNKFPEAPLQLRIASSGFQVFDQLDNAQGSVGEINPDVDHEVFVSLRLGSGTFKVSVKQQGLPEKVWTGNLHAGTLNHMKTHPRVLMMVGRHPSGTGKYVMRSILMRERE